MTLRVLPPRADKPPPRPGNVAALKITGRDYVSYSQLSTMRMCPKKFEFLYILKAEPDHQVSSLLFGGSIHSALEFHFRTLMEGLTVTPQALLGVYHDAWRR